MSKFVSIGDGLIAREVLLFNMAKEKGISTLGLHDKGLGIIPVASRRCLKIWLLDNYAKYIFGIISIDEMREIQREYNRIDRNYWCDGPWSLGSTDLSIIRIHGTKLLTVK